MTDLSTKHIQRLLAEAAPGPWEARRDYGETYQLHDAEDEYLGIMHSQDAQLTALAPPLAQEILRMRSQLAAMKRPWFAIAIDPDRLEIEQTLATYVLDHIDQILGDHDG